MNRLLIQRQLLQLLSAHFKEMIREPAVLFWGIIFPILMSLGLGIAFTKKADMIITVAVLEPASGRNSPGKNASVIESFLENNTEQLAATEEMPLQYKITIANDKLGNTIYFFRRCSWDEGMTLLKRGKLNILINEQNGRIRYNFDPLNPTAQLTYLKLNRLFNSDEMSTEEKSTAIEPLRISGSRYIDFLIPGLIAMGIMMSCMWGLSYGIIERRSQKLLRRMVATPMRKSHFLIALISVRLGMNFIESFLLFLFAYLVFGIIIQGNIGALLLIFIAGNTAFAGIAVFVSSHTARTEIGNGLINAIVFPMMVLSGIFFSYHNFPGWTVTIIQKLPLTLLTDGIRSIFIEGAGYAEIFMPFSILMVIGILFFAIGLKIFKWY
jgi:ABC-2 type transport system permease protein